MEMSAASTVCPESVRPEASVMVMEAMTGTRRAPSSKSLAMAKRAAFRFSVSKEVSGSSRSTPPSRSPRASS